MKKPSFFKALLLLSLSLQLVKSFDYAITSLSYSPSELAKPENSCKYRRVALMTDKPVYRNGETVYITAVAYNAFLKTPLSRCDQNQYTNVEVFDQDDKNLGQAENMYAKLPESAKKEKETTGIEYQYVVPDDLPGGVYKLKTQDEKPEELRFFVLKTEAKQIAVIGDWSQENAKVGDVLKGKLTLKLLTKSGPQPPASASYEFTSDGKVLARSQGSFQNGALAITFTVPPQFQKLLVFSASVSVQSRTIVYKKEFSEPSFDDIVVDVTLGNGKLVRDASNPIYFRAWEDKNRKLEVPLLDVSVLRQIGNRSTVVKRGLKTLEDGKGRFELEVSQDDFDKNAQFFLQNKFDEENTKKYLIVDLSKAGESPLFLSVDRVQSVDDQLVATVTSAAYKSTATFVIVNKGKFLYKSEKNIKVGTNTFQVDLRELNLHVGGVFTVQLYTNDQKGPKKNPKQT